MGMKILCTRKPGYLYEELIPIQGGRGGVETRLKKRTLRTTRNSYFVDRSWKNVFITQYNNLPTDITELDVREMKGKRELKVWVKENVSQFVE